MIRTSVTSFKNVTQVEVVTFFSYFNVVYTYFPFQLKIGVSVTGPNTAKLHCVLTGVLRGNGGQFAVRLANCMHRADRNDLLTPRYSIIRAIACFVFITYALRITDVECKICTCWKRISVQYKLKTIIWKAVKDICPNQIVGILKAKFKRNYWIIQLYPINDFLITNHFCGNLSNWVYWHGSVLVGKSFYLE